MKLALSLGLLLSMAPALLAEGTASTPPLQVLENQWMNAVKERDLPTIEAILAPAFTLTIAIEGAPLEVIDRSSYLEACKSFYAIHSFTFDELQIREYGDTATVASRYRQNATLGGTEDRSAEFFLVDVWVRHDGAWQVAARYSSRPEPASPAQPDAPAGER